MVDTAHVYMYIYMYMYMNIVYTNMYCTRQNRATWLM